jgi:hypothetical protein
MFKAFPLRVGETGIRKFHAVCILRQAPQHCVPERGRLLEDLLEHKVLVAALLSLNGIPGDLLKFRLLGRTRGIE